MNIYLVCIQWASSEQSVGIQASTNTMASELALAIARVADMAVNVREAVDAAGLAANTALSTVKIDSGLVTKAEFVARRMFIGRTYVEGRIIIELLNDTNILHVYSLKMELLANYTLKLPDSFEPDDIFSSPGRIRRIDVFGVYLIIHTVTVILIYRLPDWLTERHDVLRDDPSDNSRDNQHKAKNDFGDFTKPDAACDILEAISVGHMNCIDYIVGPDNKGLIYVSAGRSCFSIRPGEFPFQIRASKTRVAICQGVCCILADGKLNIGDLPEIDIPGYTGIESLFDTVVVYSSSANKNPLMVNLKGETVEAKDSDIKYAHNFSRFGDRLVYIHISNDRRLKIRDKKGLIHDQTIPPGYHNISNYYISGPNTIVCVWNMYDGLGRTYCVEERTLADEHRPAYMRVGLYAGADASANIDI